MKEADACASALARILGGTDTERAVADALRALPHLDDEGRGRVARCITATSISRLRLAHVAGVSLDAHALLEAYDRFGVEGEGTWPADPFERLVVERSCPAPLAGALVGSLGVTTADAFLASSNRPGPRTLRANTLRASRDALRERLAREGVRTVDGRHAPWALHVEGRANLFGSDAWRDGWFEVQDEGSQLVALACDAKPGDTVVDLCAGRGGKTLALAQMMGGHGTVYAHDVDERALADMQPRLSRAGVTCVQRGLPAEGTADVVLVDAPCSSTGVLRRSPDLRFRFDPASLVELARTQRALLEQGARLVKPGGTLVYATCSVLRDENDDIVRGALALGLDAVHERTLLPHVEGTDGFFVACFARR